MKTYTTTIGDLKDKRHSELSAIFQKATEIVGDDHKLPEERSSASNTIENIKRAIQGKNCEP